MRWLSVSNGYDWRPERKLVVFTVCVCVWKRERERGTLPQGDDDIISMGNINVVALREIERKRGREAGKETHRKKKM